MRQEVNNSEWRKLLEVTKLQCAAIPFIPERERAEKLCDELIVGCTDAPRPSDSDRIYRKELRDELLRILDMTGPEIYHRYGESGSRDVIRRYLEATANL